MVNRMKICICGKKFQSSQSLNAHYRWCLIKRGNRPKWDSPNKGKISPHRGKKLEEIVSDPDKTRNKISLAAKNRKPFVHTHKSKEKLSEARIKFLESSKSNVKWFVVNGIKVQGTWEKHVAEKLINSNLQFERKRLKYDGYHQYTPDFFIPSINTFIEVKGWLSDRDKKKYKSVMNDHSDKIIKILHGKFQVFNFDPNEIINLPNLKDVI